MDTSFLEQLFYGKVNPYNDIHNTIEARTHLAKIKNATEQVSILLTEPDDHKCFQDMIVSFYMANEYFVKSAYQKGMHDATAILNETVFNKNENNKK